MVCWDWLPVRLTHADDRTLGKVANGLLIGTLIIALLYAGRVAFEPLAIATLLALILTPVILRLRRWASGKAPSVLVTVLLTIAGLGMLGYTMSKQIADLADDLPRYEANLREKARALPYLSAEALDKASGTLEQLENGNRRIGSNQRTGNLTLAAWREASSGRSTGAPAEHF